MESLFSRYRNLIVLGILITGQVLFLATQVRRPSSRAGEEGGVRLIRYWTTSLVAPPERALHAIGSGIRWTWNNYIYLHNTKQQNEDLKKEINRLRFEQAELLEDARQGHRLQALLDFKQRYAYHTVASQVIGTSGTDQSRILLIDKGSSDGIKVDMAVITPDGIVGKIREVFPHTAQVLEINDPSSGAGVLLESTRTRAIMRGSSSGEPQIVNLLADERIKPGEKVLTSGGDQIYPRGLSVGVIQKVGRDIERGGNYTLITIKPSANLFRIEEVLVITDTSAQMSPQQLNDLAISDQEQGPAVAAAKQRAADMLSQRLPGLKDTPQKPADGSGTETKPPAEPSTHPLPAMHPDRFSPNYGAAPAHSAEPGSSTTQQAPATPRKPRSTPSQAPAATPEGETR